MKALIDTMWCPGVADSQVEIELLCAARRAMAIQIVFKISLESNALGTTAVTALSREVASGGLASAFTATAAARNEVVLVQAGILDTACVTCGATVAVVSALDVSGSIYAMISTLQITIILVLLTLWVYGVRNMRTQIQIFPVPHAETATNQPVEAGMSIPLAIPDANWVDRQKRFLPNTVTEGESADIVTEVEGVAKLSASPCPTSQPECFGGHNPLDILKAAAMNCG